MKEDLVIEYRYLQLRQLLPKTKINCCRKRNFRGSENFPFSKNWFWVFAGMENFRSPETLYFLAFRAENL